MRSMSFGPRFVVSDRILADHPGIERTRVFWKPQSSPKNGYSNCATARLSLRNTPRHYLMDTLRMLAHRAELGLARQLASHQSKPETAHEMVRDTLFTSEASLGPDHRAGVLEVCLLHQSRNCLDEALKPLRAELNKTRMIYSGTNRRLVHEFVSG